MKSVLALLRGIIAQFIPERRAHWRVMCILLPFEGVLGTVRSYHLQEVGGYRRLYVGRLESLGGWRQYKVGEIISSEYNATRGEHFTGGSYFTKVTELPRALSKLEKSS